MPFGLAMVGPVIYTFGTPEQKASSCRASCRVRIGGARAIPNPAFGSDLASLRTKARARWRSLYRQRPEDLDDDGAARRLGLFPRPHQADVKQQEGISFLLIDMKTPRHHGAPDHHARRRT
jgi:alkylation response protein AidB-like acyl-CoA dehydrogenase